MDSWHSLVKMVKETDVSGEVLIRLLLSETETGLDQLTVTVVKARDIKVCLQLFLTRSRAKCRPLS